MCRREGLTESRGLPAAAPPGSPSGGALGSLPSARRRALLPSAHPLPPVEWEEGGCPASLSAPKPIPTLTPAQTPEAPGLSLRRDQWPAKGAVTLRDLRALGLQGTCPRTAWPLRSRTDPRPSPAPLSAGSTHRKGSAVWSSTAPHAWSSPSPPWLCRACQLAACVTGINGRERRTVERMWKVWL